MILELLAIIILATTTGPVDPNPNRINTIPTQQYFVEDHHFIIPAYWRGGCSPTAAGIVLSYWDTKYNVIDEIQQSIASNEHYQDYSIPIDNFSNILDDKSELPIGDEHSDNSIADVMNTSKSFNSLPYGFTWLSNIEIGLEHWITERGYTPTISSAYYSDSDIWEIYITEINENRPVLLNIITSRGLHSVAGIGYGYLNNEPYFATYNTWSKSITWYQYKPYNGQPYSIFGLFTIDIDGIEIERNKIYLPIVRK